MKVSQAADLSSKQWQNFKKYRKCPALPEALSPPSFLLNRSSVRGGWGRRPPSPRRSRSSCSTRPCPRSRGRGRPRRRARRRPGRPRPSARRRRAWWCCGDNAIISRKRFRCYKGNHVAEKISLLKRQSFCRMDFAVKKAIILQKRFHC